MLRRIITSSLALLCVTCLLGTTTTASELEQMRFAQKVRTEIEKLGVGPDAIVEVRLRDKKEIKGYVVDADSQGFIVMDSKSSETTTVAYPEVQKVKGHNLATGVKIGIGVGVVLLTLVLFCVIYKPCASS